MKLKLEITLSESDVKNLLQHMTMEELKESMEDEFFEMVENWVVRGDKPDLEWVE